MKKINCFKKNMYIKYNFMIRIANKINNDYNRKNYKSINLKNILKLMSIIKLTDN